MDYERSYDKDGRWEENDQEEFENEMEKIEDEMKEKIITVWVMILLKE